VSRSRTRRALLVGSLLAAALAIGCCASRDWPLHSLGGASSHAPSEMSTGLSAGARALLDDVLRDLDDRKLVDYHTHVFGSGADGSGCSVNPKFFSFWHPWKRVQFAIYLDAARVGDLEHAESQYMDRLNDLVRAMPIRGRHCLLAFERNYRGDGAPDSEHTDLYVPNDYVWQLAERWSDLYTPVISVHPYRSDALGELDRFGQRGVRLVKWLPNAMNIDPADPRCDEFYARMKRWEMTLLSHTGDEQAVDAGAQTLGNPLRLRRALDAGVRVIFAHCGSLGVGSDLDDPEHKRVRNFDLFLRVMGEKRYEGLAFGEISAITEANRSKDVLATLLARTDLHARLVNGSDYPLPAMNAVFSTRKLEWEGFLTSEERRALNEIYDYNPLLFDLALKRTVHHPVTGQRFPPAVFLGNAALGP
jgi:predicted TIM-barrel fold metal-dependent hydrolase